MEIFHRCCQEGHLTRSVMTQLKLCLSTKEFEAIQSTVIDKETNELSYEFTRKERSQIRYEQKIATTKRLQTEARSS